MENLKEELDFINKLKEAMEIGLKREVFMPEILKVKYYINHQSELLKLNKSDVISSVCDHKFDDIDVNYVDGIIICNRCHVTLEGKQTDL